MEELKNIGKTISTYFPDVWHYIVIIIVMIIAAIFIL